jgi:hypothetical protein
MSGKERARRPLDPAREAGRILGVTVAAIVLLAGFGAGLIAGVSVPMVTFRSAGAAIVAYLLVSRSAGFAASAILSPRRKGS